MTAHLTTEKMKNHEQIRIIMDLFIAHLKGENLAGFFDVNKLSEDFFCVILNKTYALNLVNLNKTGKLDYKAIDLGDEKNGVTYQITSENTRKKVKKNLEGYISDGRYTTYPQLKFLILDRSRPAKIADLARTGDNFTFDPATDVICMRELLAAVELLEEEIVSEVLEYIKKEIPLWEIMTEQSVDSEIVHIVDDILEKSHNTAGTSELDHLDTPDKIKLNFGEGEDSEFITAEYRRCLPRFKSIERIIDNYGSDDETILQSSMADLYNKLKQDKTKTNREIFDLMIESIDMAAPLTERQAARRLAIKSLVMFHFEDCTIFEKTVKEKERLVLK